MTAAVPNQNGDVVFSNQFYRIDMALRGYSVKSGLAPTGGGTTTMEVDIAVGVAWVNGVEVPFAGDSIAISAADANYPRKDLVSIDSTGTLQVTEGTPGAADPSGDSGAQTFTPVPPALPADETLICEVWVAAAAVGIVDANITDRRLITTTAFGAFDYGLSFEGAVTEAEGSDIVVFSCSSLSGHGENYFKDYWAYVVWDADGAGAAPQTEKRKITASTDDGEFTIASKYSADIGVGDKVQIIHPAIMGDVIVEVGEMSDTATAADLSDIATTSVHAKLGRLLLRFSADAFAATVNGSSRADIEAMVTGLASYVKAAGATFAPSIGGSTRADIDAALAALDAEVYTSAHTLKTPNTKIGDIARTIDLIMGARWDSTGDLGTDIATLIADIGDASGDNLTSVVAKLGDDTLTVKARLDAIDSAIAAIPTTAMRGTDSAFLASEGDKVPKSDGSVSWNATALGAIEAEVEDGLEGENLNYLAKDNDGGAAYPTKVADNSILGIIMTKQSGGDVSDFDSATDSLEAIADAIAGISAGAGTATIEKQNQGMDGTTNLSGGWDADTDNLHDISDAVAAIPTTAMRGTDNAALASVLGALADAAAAGEVTEADTAMAYIKQLVTAIQLIPTTAMRGTDSAFLAAVGGALNDAAAEGAVTETDTAMAYIKQLVTAIQLIPTTAMRGTDNAALASVLGALNNAAAEGAVTDADTAMAYLKQLVTAIQLIPTTAMRGTDNAFLASVGGALDTSAVYAVAADKTAMAYIKGLVDAGIAVAGSVSDVNPIQTDFDTDLTEATDDHYNLQAMMFYTGVLKGQSQDIIDYTGVSKNCAFYAYAKWTEAPANGDKFLIFPYSCGKFNSISMSLQTDLIIDTLGALDTAAATGAVSDAKMVMAYIKQCVTAEIAIQAKTDLILPGTKFATKTSTEHLTSGDLFSWTGSIGIVSIIGRVTTALEAATAQTIKLTCTPDALTATDLCATKDANAFGVGSLLTITGTLADAMIGTTVVGCAVSQASMITCTCVTSGKISVVFGTSGSKDGAIVWELLWIPLTPGATCVAAA